jgi:hypothetical protein
MTDKREIRQLGMLLVDLFGPEAAPQGLRRMKAAMRRGDRRGARKWRKAVEAVRKTS